MSCSALACIGVLATGCSPVPDLARQLQDPDVQTRRAAAHVLAKMAPVPTNAMPALEISLNDPDSEVRRTATAALGNMGARAEPALPELTKLLQHEEFATRFAAALAVQEIAPTSDVFQPVLVEAMTAGDVGTIVAVGEMGPGAVWAVNHLETLLRHPDSNVRVLAVQSLGQIGARQAEPALRRATSDANPGVREAAAQALEAIGRSGPSGPQ